MAELTDRIILVVEDEYLLADDLTQTLRHSGAVVLGPVGHLADAMALVMAADRLDGAVLDINLHGEPVYPLIDILAARGVPHVLVTGYTSGMIPDQYRNIPLYEKPIEASLMAEALALSIRDRTAL